MSCVESFKKRRSYYSLSSESPLRAEAIENIIRENLLHAPSAFNSQSARLILLLGEEQLKFWDLVKGELKKIVDPQSFSTTEAKINSCFRAGHGTVLFFEDMSVVKKLQDDYPAYKDAFPTFSHHSAGMLQFMIWTALEEVGFGASLQHYNPVIDKAVQASWKLPESWKLLAQMPFGTPLASPSEKSFLPLEERFKIFR